DAAPYAERERALRAIAFDASADQELRLGFANTGAARLLLEAAQAAVNAGRYSAAIVLTRQAVPQLEARRWEDVPVDVWRTAFPLPYAAAIRSSAARQAIDPMLVAGLIRQESAFDAHAVSRANALGLMQIVPGTAKRLARSLKMRFSRAKLFQPEYNLELGTKYLADLLRLFGNVESVLAAYDAGEDRIPGWQSERNYEETAEFVDSIPFTETREYVQIVKRNAEIYRRLAAGR
ncbi:MAG: lytic transglycosylase domain-containing protein, partial [Acidipila sp.]|nr:lytic transglycosylase domain-containing protein [Acidipila sp.]